MPWVKVEHNLVSNLFPFVLLSYNVRLLSEIYIYLLLTYWFDIIKDHFSGTDISIRRFEDYQLPTGQP